MRRVRSHRAGSLLIAAALGAAGCAEILGLNEGKPRPADGGGGAGGEGGDPGVGGAGGDGGAPPAIDAPRVLFTDLESGPSGAYVTLHGVRLVELSDAPEVTFGGAPVEVIEARDGDLNPDAARALDTVVVRVGPEVPVGPVDVVARRGGEASEPVSFRVRPGAIRVVDAVAGDDQSADCAEASPCATLGKLASVLEPGDVAYVREADYAGGATCGVNYAGDPIECALSLMELASAGTAQLPIAVVGFPGERPRIGLVGGPPGAEFLHIAFGVADAGHVVLSNLVFVDAGVGGTVRDTESLRVVGCRFESYAIDGIQAGVGVDEVTVLGSTFASGPLYTVRGLQVCDATQIVAEVAYSEFDGVPAPVSLDPTQALDVRIHGNLLHRVFAGLDFQSCAPSNPQPIGRTSFFNNIIDDSGWALVLPRESTFGAEVLVFNNTFRGFEYCAFRREDPAVAPIPGDEAIHFRNNVVVPLAKPYFCFHDMGAITPADDVGVVGSHNLFWSGTGALPAALGVEADPLLADPPADLSLVAGSPGIDAGTEALGGDVVALPPHARLDHAGLPRVLGDAIDIGAYELAPE